MGTFGLLMNNEAKKDLILGMCYALAGCFRAEFSGEQCHTFAVIAEAIEEIYNPKKDLSKPTPRGEE